MAQKEGVWGMHVYGWMGALALLQATAATGKLQCCALSHESAFASTVHCQFLLCLHTLCIMWLAWT